MKPLGPGPAQEGAVGPGLSDPSGCLAQLICRSTFVPLVVVFSLYRMFLDFVCVPHMCVVL